MMSQRFSPLYVCAWGGGGGGGAILDRTKFCVTSRMDGGGRGNDSGSACVCCVKWVVQCMYVCMWCLLQFVCVLPVTLRRCVLCY